MAQEIALHVLKILLLFQCTFVQMCKCAKLQCVNVQMCKVAKLQSCKVVENKGIFK